MVLQYCLAAINTDMNARVCGALYSTVWLLSTQTSMNVMTTVHVRLSLSFHVHVCTWWDLTSVCRRVSVGTDIRVSSEFGTLLVCLPAQVR